MGELGTVSDAPGRMVGGRSEKERVSPAELELSALTIGECTGVEGDMEKPATSASAGSGACTTGVGLNKTDCGAGALSAA